MPLAIFVLKQTNKQPTIINMKPRILWNNESSVLKTGYAVYGKEILNRLHATGKYELAELACYVSQDDSRLKNIPWKVYPNLPNPNNQEEVNRYNSDNISQFGAWKFESVCVDFLPHIVISITDYWMQSHIDTSPFRKYYNWITMPTCDAYPQHEQWLNMYASADCVFTYQDWSKKILEDESGGKIKVLHSAPPASDSAFYPYSKENRKQIKAAFGFEDCFIIGTVMRNQRRKLYPDLFKSFAKILKNNPNKNLLLYCHTSYPDMGWDIPKLLLQFGISSKVLFTYVCRNCKHAFPSFFNDALMTCHRCGELAATLSNVQEGVDNDNLAKIYNMFDLYVQYHCSEGFGIPVIEAAACGTPVMGIDYSAVTDVIRKVAGKPLKPKTLYMEMETGCYRAVPDNKLFIETIQYLLSMSSEKLEEWRTLTRKSYQRNYSWDTTASKWEQYFDSVDVNDYEQRWFQQPRIVNPPNNVPQNISNQQFARWLITEVLAEPRYINSYMESRLIHDLNYNVTSPGIAGMYFNEMSASFVRPHWQEFNRQKAFEHIYGLRQRINKWEEIRWQRIKHR